MAGRPPPGAPPSRGGRAGARDEYHAIVLLEPHDARNRAALGFDMSTEPVRREAMGRARDTGRPAASGPVTLVQEIEPVKQQGFLVYVPVYEGRPETVEARRERLRGFVYAAFRADDLVLGILGPAGSTGMAIEVRDLDAPGAPGPRAARGGGGEAPGSTAVLDVAGRRWLLSFASRDGLPRPSSSAAQVVLALGTVLGLLLAAVTQAQVRARARAEDELRERRRAELAVREQAATTERLSRVGAGLAAELDLDALVQRLTDEATSLCEARFGAFCYDVVDERGASLMLRAVGGVARERLGERPPPPITAPTAPTFRGEGPIRLGDVTRDPRFREDEPLLGLPAGHGSVRSYLAVPVISRTREVIGGLFFGHPDPDVFTEQHERLVVAVAAHAAVAMDNARLYQQAQDAVRSRDVFLSVASHELKTPLTTLLLQVQALLRASERADGGAEKLRSRAESIQGQARRLGALVDGLLDVSRITSGKLELELEDVDLAALARGGGSRFEEQAARAGCTLRIEAPQHLEGRWDPLRLEQVLVNLLGNAAKYAPGKPVDVAVRVVGDRALLEVRDRGIGIPAKDQSRIFDRFERLFSERTYGGFGLGLWICRQIVEAHGGAIEVESVAGEGATFRVSLPLRAAPTPEGAPAQA